MMEQSIGKPVQVCYNIREDKEVPMKFYSTLNETLEKRFDDMDEVSDIATHGINCGYSGFLYNYELNEFFNEFENEIENYYYEIFGDEWLKESGAADCDSMDSMRAHLVWGLVEMWCGNKVEEDE